jgi:hypothetical protein
VDWAGPENPSDAPRIEPVRWELCGSDAYVSGPARVPQEAGHHDVRERSRAAAAGGAGGAGRPPGTGVRDRTFAGAEGGC